MDHSRFKILPASIEVCRKCNNTYCLVISAIVDSDIYLKDRSEQFIIVALSLSSNQIIYVAI